MNILGRKSIKYKEKVLNYLHFPDFYNINILVIITQTTLSMVCVLMFMYSPFHMENNDLLIYIIIGNAFLLLLDIIFRVVYTSKHFQLRLFIAFYVPLIMYVLSILSHEDTLTYTIANGIFLLSTVLGLCYFKPHEKNIIWAYLLVFYLLYSFRKEVGSIVLIDNSHDVKGFNNVLFTTHTYIRLFLYGGIMGVFYYLDNRYKLSYEKEGKQLLLYETHYKILALQEKQLEKKCQEYNSLQNLKKINFVTIYAFFENLKRIQSDRPSTWGTQILFQINKLINSSVGYLIKVGKTDNKLYFEPIIHTGVLLENQKIEAVNNQSSLYRCYKEKNFIHEKDTQGNYHMASISTSLGSSKTSYRLYVPVTINNEVAYIFVFVQHRKWKIHIIDQLMEIADLVSGQLLYSIK